MPRRSTGESPAPRRQSARIAAVAAAKPATPSPTKKTPKRAAKKSSKAETVVEDNQPELNGSVASQEEQLRDVDAPAEKKARQDSNENAKDFSDNSKCEESKTEPGGNQNATNEADGAGTVEGGFEVVEKADIPAADSDAVKAAIAAQGEDGQLLVNYVQVTKDDVPPPDEAAAALPSGDPPKIATEENNNGTADAPPAANGLGSAPVQSSESSGDPAKEEAETKDGEKPEVAAEQSAPAVPETTDQKSDGNAPDPPSTTAAVSSQ